MKKPQLYVVQWNDIQSDATWHHGSLEKAEQALIEGLALVDACLRQVALLSPEWWVLENPVGRLKDFLGTAVYNYQPHWFAGLADDPDSEAYTKRTCLWGKFNVPSDRAEVPPIHGSKMHLLPPSKDRAQLRSQTPQGFARAFFRANP